MKKIGRIAFRLILVIISFFIVIFIIAYIYFSSEWRKYYSDADIRRYADSINQTPNLDKTFYFIYDKLHYNDRHKGMTTFCLKTISEIIFGGHNNEINYYTRAGKIISLTENKQKNGYPAFTLGWALSKYTTPEKCFDYALMIENRGYLQHAKYNKRDSVKNIYALKDTNEIIEYILISESPSKYRNNPDKLKQRIEDLKVKLKE